VITVRAVCGADGLLEAVFLFILFVRGSTITFSGTRRCNRFHRHRLVVAAFFGNLDTQARSPHCLWMRPAEGQSWAASYGVGTFVKAVAVQDQSDSSAGQGVCLTNCRAWGRGGPVETLQDDQHGTKMAKLGPVDAAAGRVGGCGGGLASITSRDVSRLLPRLLLPDCGESMRSSRENAARPAFTIEVLLAVSPSPAISSIAQRKTNSGIAGARRATDDAGARTGCGAQATASTRTYGSRFFARTLSRGQSGRGPYVIGPGRVPGAPGFFPCGSGGGNSTDPSGSQKCRPRGPAAPRAIRHGSAGDGKARRILIFPAGGLE